MKRNKFYAIILIIVIMFSQSIISAAQLSPEDEKVRINFNGDMENIYGKPTDYYPLKWNGQDLNVYYKNQVRDEKTSKSSPILCYGKLDGDYENGVYEYLGKSKMGIDIPNPQFGWNAGWDGIVISKWGDKEPWGIDKAGNYMKKTFNVPGMGLITLEKAIQTGVDIVYGGKTYNDVKSKSGPAQRNHANKIVHKSGDAPPEGWLPYVEVAIVPTQYTWGQGTLRKKDGSYMGIPIAPFKFITSDLEVDLSTTSSDPVRNGERVNISATVYSSHDKVNTDYKLRSTN